MPTYDTAHFEPPAPLAFVILQDPGTGATVQDVPMLLDRGQFLLIDQEWGILRRNILNAISLILDGPDQSWNEWHPT